MDTVVVLFVFFSFVLTSFGTQVPNVCQCLHVETSVHGIALWHLNLVTDCLRRLYTCTEFELLFIFIIDITMQMHVHLHNNSKSACI